MLEFIKENVQQLKREYGRPLVIGKNIGSEVDFVTGRRTNQVVESRIEKAIVLPNQINSQFLQSLGMQIQALDIVVGTIQVLVDLEDVPDSILITDKNLYALKDDRRFNIVKADVYPYAAILWLKDIGQQKPTSTLSSSLTFTQLLSVEIA